MVVDVSCWVASHFKYKSNIVYSLWLWNTKIHTGDPETYHIQNKRKAALLSSF